MDSPVLLTQLTIFCRTSCPAGSGLAAEFSSGYSHTCPAVLRLSALTINSLCRALWRAVCHKARS